MEVQRFHGVDLHKRHATVSVRDRSGEEVRLHARVLDFAAYVGVLGPEDAVVLEASSGTFFWADAVRRQGACCVVIDPRRFRIIRDSWQKTDRRDATNLSLALWLSQMSHQVRLPEVYQPEPVIRTLRQLFAQWQVLNKQIRQLKNQVHGLLTDNGIAERSLGTGMVDRPAKGLETLGEMKLPTEEVRACIQIDLELLSTLMEKKARLKSMIIQAGRPLESQVRLLIGIRGITPLLALAFLSDVGDIRRFRKLKGLYAYLGVVPTVHSSGDVTRLGHITRQSRSLTRTLFTQAVLHLSHSSRTLEKWYSQLLHRKGRGRARIAVIRRAVAMMRHMLLFNEPYAWMEEPLYEQKLKEYQRELSKAA